MLSKIHLMLVYTSKTWGLSMMGKVLDGYCLSIPWDSIQHVLMCDITCNIFSELFYIIKYSLYIL